MEDMTHAKKMTHHQPCLHCGSKDIVWIDCGYSSFNCATVQCRQCKFELKLENLSCQPDKEVRKAWNAQRKKAVNKLKKLRQEVARLEKLLGSDVSVL
jgi:hypothetical protein